jgi:hypothetical protein
MKILRTPLLLILLLILSQSIAFAQETDVEESSDHPLFPRMEHFYISGYERYDRESHEFYDAEDNEYVIEGPKWVIEYTLRTGFESPGQLKVRENHINAVNRMRGTVLFDRGLYMKVVRGNKETWIDVWISDYGTDYRLTIVERTATRHKAGTGVRSLARDTERTATRSLAGKSTQKTEGTQDPDIKRIEAALRATRRNRDDAVANLSEIVQKVSDGLSMVCFDAPSSPVPPAGDIQVPYPKIGKTSDVAKGTQKVKIAADEAEALAKESSFKETESDEIGRSARTLVELIRNHNERGTIPEEDKVSWKDRLLDYQDQAIAIARALENHVEEIERLLAESKRELGIK